MEASLQKRPFEARNLYTFFTIDAIKEVLSWGIEFLNVHTSMGQCLRFLFLLMTLASIAFGLSYRIFWIASKNRPYFQKFINSARHLHQVKHATRGTITDRYGIPLALTTRIFDLGVDPYSTKAQEMAQKLPQLAQLLQIPIDTLKKCFQKESFVKEGKVRQVRWKHIAHVDDPDVYEQIQALKIAGVYGVPKEKRFYPWHSVASHVIGFINNEGTPVSGIERFMNEFLQGQDGWIDSEKNGKRQEIVLFRETEVLPRDGSDIELTLDVYLQSTIEPLLEQAVTALNAKSATAIISDPTTGELLTLCNFPTFDCNTFNKADPEVLRNRAITDTYEPGSVFKIVPFSIALQQGVISLRERFDCTSGTFTWNRKTYLLPKDHTELGHLSATDVLRKSSNRGTAQIGIRLGERRLYNAARAFGFGERTGYGFDGEVSGILHAPERWDSLTITRLPMGHAVGATALQVHQAMGVIASGGYLLEPKVIRRVLDRGEEELGATGTFEEQEEEQDKLAEGNGDASSKGEFKAVDLQFLRGTKGKDPSTEEIYGGDHKGDCRKEEQGKAILFSGAHITRRVLTAEMARKMREILYHPDAKPAEIGGMRIGYKTGTTQKLIDGHYSQKHHVSSCSGFFPVETPRYIVTVVVDDAQVGSGTAYGARVAYPIFCDIIRCILLRGALGGRD